MVQIWGVNFIFKLKRMIIFFLGVLYADNNTTIAVDSKNNFTLN